MSRIVLLTLAGVAAAITLVSGQTATQADTFTATVANVDAVSPSFSVNLLRWSTDAQRDQITGAFAKGDEPFQTALKGMETVGYLWTGESVGYPIRYAVKQTLPDGTERIILVTDRQLGAYSTRRWSAVAPVQTQSYGYTLVELRLPKGRPGEGKLSLMAKVTTDATAKTIAIDDYAAAPTALRNVRR